MNRTSYNTKIKSFIIVLVAVCLLLSVTQTKTYSLTTNPITWIKDQVNDKISTMADEMLSGIGQRISEAIYDIATSLVDGMVSGFGPSFDAFDKAMSGESVKDVGSSSSSPTSTSANTLIYFSKVFGFGLAILILLVSLLAFFWSKPGELKDTPMRLIIKFFFAFILIKYSADIMGEVFSMANTMWTDYVMTADVGGTPGTVTYDVFTKLIETIGLMNLIAVIPAIGAFLCVFQLLIAWPLIKGFVKFYIEIIERYLVIILLYVFFGAAAATIVSNNTSNIFKSYLRMIASQMFILFTNVLFMKIFVYVLLNGGWTCSIPNYIFGLAYLRICQRIDSYMAMLGLNVAQTGGQTLDALLGAGQGIMGAFRGLNSAREGAMNVGSAVAAKNGDYKTAAALREGTNTKGFANMMASGGIDALASQIASESGGHINADTATAARTIEGFMTDPKNRKNNERLQSYDKQSLIDGMNAMFKENGIDMKVTDVNKSRMGGGQLGFTAETGSGENKHTISGILSAEESPKGTSTKFKDGYMSTKDKEAGEGFKNDGDSKVIHKGNAETLGYQTGYSNIINAQYEGYKNMIKGARYNNKNGSTELLDKNNKTIGTINNVNGKPALTKKIVPSENSKLGEEGTVHAAFGNTISKNIIEDGKEKELSNQEPAEANMEKIENTTGLEDIKWEKIDEKKGKAVGTATMKDEHGNERKVDVLGTDMGRYGYSGKGTIVDIGDSNAIEIRTRAVSENKVDTAASAPQEEPATNKKVKPVGSDEGSTAQGGKPAVPENKSDTAASAPQEEPATDKKETAQKAQKRKPVGSYEESAAQGKKPAGSERKPVTPPQS